jgi:hypothetical protein
MMPDGGQAVGSWGGSANIDARNQVMFRDVPPRRYTIQGRPNPSSADQHSKPLTIELNGGQASRIKLPAHCADPNQERVADIVKSSSFRSSDKAIFVTRSSLNCPRSDDGRSYSTQV